ncbi:MAG: hypothetical protein ACLQIQ_15960 [Beijerinckiaceae bacterium]
MTSLQLFKFSGKIRIAERYRQENHRQEDRLRSRVESQPGTLREDVEVFAAEQKARDFKDTTISRDETVDADHGHIETRTTTAIYDVGWL